MNGRAACRYALVFLALWGLTPAHPAGADDLKDMRVLCVYSNCFEYLFASVVSGTGDNATLAFNYLGGRTVFVKIGQPLGEYVVESVTTGSQEVFNPTINTNQTVKTGVATLKKEGETIRLEMGRPLPRPGYQALVAWLDTGDAAYLRPGDLVTGTTPQMTVKSVRPGSVTLASPNGVTAVANATSEERVNLSNLWQARRESEQRGRVAVAFSKDDAIRAEQQAAQQADEQRQAALAAPLRPRRIVQVTYDPLLITSMTKVNQVVAQFIVPVTTIQNGQPVTSYETKEITVPMPQFEKFEYRGTILRYAD